MGNLKKQMLFSILIALVSSASHGSNTKKNSNDENELIILGTYQKLENIFKKNKINGNPYDNFFLFTVILYYLPIV